MNAHDYAKQVLAGGDVSQVYWVACGGSVIDLYPANCLINANSKSMTSAIHTAAEFNTFPPAQLGPSSLVVTCSHSGGTAETIEATALAKERGARVVTMTNRAGSKIDNGEWPCWVYKWEDDTPQSARPAGFSLTLAADLMAAQDRYAHTDALAKGIGQLDGIIAAAKPRVESELGPRFADLCKSADFSSLGSGPTSARPMASRSPLAHGDAVAELLLHQLGRVLPRPLRVHRGRRLLLPAEGLRRQQAHRRARRSASSKPTRTPVVLDSAEYGMANVDTSVRTYLDPIFFYEMNVSCVVCVARRLTTTTTSVATWASSSTSEVEHWGKTERVEPKRKRGLRPARY